MAPIHTCIPHPALCTLTRRTLTTPGHILHPSPTPLLKTRLSSSSSSSSSSTTTPRRTHPPNFTPPTTADLADLRQAVQSFTAHEIPPSLAHTTDTTNAFPPSLWPKLGAAGLLGITAPTAHGGLNMGYEAHCIALEEISKASGSIGLSYAAHSQLCVNQISLNGTADQQSRFLPGLIRGEVVGALAMSESGAGSDVVGGMRTKAVEVEGGWVVNGTKMWITNGPDAGVVVVYARTEDGGKGKGMTAFLVEGGSKGFSCARKLDKLGMRGSNTGELVFEDVFVPHGNVLGEVGKGVRVLMEGLDIERLILSAGPLGIMAAALALTLPYTHTRTQFGKPLAHNQLVQAKLADMYTKHRASSSFTYAVARALDTSHADSPTASGPNTQDCAAAILFAAERATECALDAIQLLGGMGYVNEMPAGRLLRDAKLYEIGAGTSEVRRIVIGRALSREVESGG